MREVSHRLLEGGAEVVLLPLGALLVSLLLFGGFVAIAGANPLDVYHRDVPGRVRHLVLAAKHLVRSAPLMLTALCTAVPARLGLISIGGEGALVLGGLAAAVTALAFPAGPWRCSV